MYNPFQKYNGYNSIVHFGYLWTQQVYDVAAHIPSFMFAELALSSICPVVSSETDIFNHLPPCRRHPRILSPQADTQPMARGKAIPLEVAGKQRGDGRCAVVVTS